MLFCFLAVIVFSFVYVFAVVNPVVVQASRQAIYSLSTTAVSEAVYDVLNEEDISYEDLVRIERNSNGDVKLISLETVLLNKIARRFYSVAQKYIDQMGRDGISVPVGCFTGIPFLAGVGPLVNLKLISIGTMTSSFKSKFSSCGVNQTNHSLYIDLNATISLILPAFSANIDSVTEVLVAENVIVGDVPKVYFGSSLNFSPN